MKVIKHIKSTGAKTKVNYPAVWGSRVKGLISDIEFYEIQYLDKPDYNPEQFECKEKIVLTQDKGEALNIAIIEWVLQEKSQSLVIINFNNSFGAFIDSAYPLWQRIKDNSTPTDDGVSRKTQEQTLRDDRQQREDAYLNDNIFPNFNFQWL